MKRRTLWGSLALVVALLVGASRLAGGAAVDWSEVGHRLLAWRDGARPVVARLAEQVAAGATLDRLALPAAGLLGVLLIVLVVRRRRRAPAEAPVAFRAALDEALDDGGPAGSPRHAQVLRLAREGEGVAAIARSTRLSQDAVRAVIAGREAA